MERPYLQPVYDEPEFIVRTVWRLYGGWWDGNPATLKPAPERAVALELADLAGGAGRPGRPGPGPHRMGRAGPPGRGRALRLAGHLAELAWLAAPDDPGVQEARRTVFTRRADAASSTMAQGVFSWAARSRRELAFRHGLPPQPVSGRGSPLLNWEFVQAATGGRLNF